MFSETRYALNGDLRVAYRASREGPRDIVFIPNWFTCCEHLPELPSLQGWVEVMTSLGRLIFFDQPGTGTVPTTRPILRAAALSDSVLSGASFGGRLLLVAGSHLPPELDHLFLKVDHSLGAHGCQSNEFHDYGPYPAMAGEGFVELREPVVEFPSDNGFWVERYSPHFAECREVGCFFRIGLHLASVGRLPRPEHTHRRCRYSPNCRHHRGADLVVVDGGVPLGGCDGGVPEAARPPVLPAHAFQIAGSS
jgi:hypothetical protein